MICPDMLIQTIYERKQSESILPSEMSLEQDIQALHSKGESAYIIVCAPIAPPKASLSYHFEDVANDGIVKYVTAKKELENAGLDDFAQVRKDANAFRQGGSVKAKARTRGVIAA